MPGRQDKETSGAGAGFAERRSARGDVVLVAEAALADALVEHGLLEDQPLERLDGAAASAFAGRGRPLLLSVGGARLVAKAMLHGGLLRGLLSDRFLGDARARALVAVHRRLEERGVAAPRLAFARVRRGGALVRLDAATHEIAGARDGLAFLQSSPPPPLRRAAARAAGRTVRALHDAGVEHADLNVKNLLVVAPAAEPAVFVIDFDKSRVGASLSPAAAVRNLERLARSATKLGLVGRALPRTDLVRFARAYAGDDWRRVFAATKRRLDALLPLHRLSWAWSRGVTSAGDRGSARSGSTTPATPCTP
jgi:3-deoxy-D-manno-octulosonic acid kinase